MDITELVAQRLASLGMDPQMAYGPNVATPASVVNALAPAPSPAPAPANAMAPAPAPAGYYQRDMEGNEVFVPIGPGNRPVGVDPNKLYRSTDPIWSNPFFGSPEHAESYTKDWWAQVLPQLGFKGEIFTPGSASGPAFYDDSGGVATTPAQVYTPQAQAFINQMKSAGYDIGTYFKGGDLLDPAFRLVGPNNEVLANFDQPSVSKQAVRIAAPLILGNIAAAYGLFGGATGAGAGGVGIAEGMAPANAGALGAGGGAVDYSLATQAGALGGTGAGLGTLPSTGVPGAINYGLATQPVYGSGAGLAAGTAPFLGTGAGIAVAPGVSPVLGNPASFINQPANLPPTVTTPGGAPGGAVVSPAGAAGSALGSAASTLGQAAGSAASGLAKGLGESSIWGPLLSTLTSLYGGKETAEATREAARLQSEAANRAIGLQETMYREGVARQAPFLQEGTAAFNRLAALQRGGPEAAQQFLTTEPGYGFRLGEGLKALERTQAARGNLLSGGAIKAGQRYAQDVASQEYSNAYNRLAQMAGIGPQAAGVANTLGQSYASNVGNLMTQQGTGAANALIAGATARQSAYGDIGEAWGRYFSPQPTINYLGGGGYGR